MGKPNRIARIVAPIVGILAGGMLIAAGAFARPVVPEFVIDFPNREVAAGGRQLMLIYGEKGSDPFRSGTLLPDQRVAHCRTAGTRCVSEPARARSWRPVTRRQSLQIRVLNGRGNPIVGGVEWTGRAYPRRVRVVCDLRIGNRRAACSIANPVA